jgi:hypothetical protein
MKTEMHQLFDPDEVTERLCQNFSYDLSTAPLKQLHKGGHSFDYIGAALNAFTKKYRSQKANDHELHNACVDDFLANCTRLRGFDPRRPQACLGQGVQSGTSFDGATFELLIERAKTVLHGAIGLGLNSFEESWFEACRNGTGTTIGVKYVDTSWEAKFTFPITGTADAIKLFVRYLDWDPQLKAILYDLNRKYIDRCKRNGKPVKMFKCVRGSRLSSVPKDDKKVRIISIMPTLNMFFQQGLMDLLVEACQRLALSLDKLPQQHQQLALEASVTLKKATVDCKSASDCVILFWLSQLPGDFSGALDLVRCKEMQVTYKGQRNKDSAWITLPMVSTMGDASTFPLETLIFYSIAVAAIDVCRPRVKPRNSSFVSERSLKEVSVFGDDIIIPDWSYGCVTAALSRFGFMINSEKSFHGDFPFRESCGGDYFDARDVRPFFLERPNSKSLNEYEAWLYNIWNALSTKYISYFGERDWVYRLHVFRYLADLLKGLGTIKIVPSYYPSTAGILDPDPRLLLNLGELPYSPIYMNVHGLCAFRALEFEYLQDNVSMRRSFQKLGLYKALKKPTRNRRWIKKRQCGFWMTYDRTGFLQIATDLHRGPLVRAKTPVS